MILDRVVIRLKDRSIMKGRTTDFYVDKSVFHVKLLSGELVRVNLEDLKAAFLVKTFQGNKSYKCSYRDILPWGGHRIKVEFNDGEVIIGYTPHHINGHKGFFITPADSVGNNKEVFVVKSATKEITYL
jgi:hypothetical protein